jgi:hypothetical protein
MYQGVGILPTTVADLIRVIVREEQGGLDGEQRDRHHRSGADRTRGAHLHHPVDLRRTA